MPVKTNNLQLRKNCLKKKIKFNDNVTWDLDENIEKGLRREVNKNNWIDIDLLLWI